MGRSTARFAVGGWLGVARLPSAAGVAQGAPATAGRAHFDPNRHGAGLAFALLLPPGFGIGPGRLKGVVVVIENGVGRSVAIHPPIEALLLGPGAEGREGRRRNQSSRS